MTDLPLRGKNALVTGGTRGIGAAITRKLIAWGATVTAGWVDRAETAQQLVQELGPALRTHRADVTDPEQLLNIIAEAAERSGRLDVVVHSAAAAAYAPVPSLKQRQWQFTEQVILAAFRDLAVGTRQHLSHAEHPRLIAITNTTPLRIVPEAAALAVTKAGVEALVRYLAYEFARDGIVVNAVRPGVVPTDVLIARPQYRAAIGQERDASPWPDGRTTQASDVADVVAALTLPEMSWVAGQVINVDGGAGQWAWQGRRDG